MLSLSKDREWAGNHAIQAAADVFRVSIEIINSNSASFVPVTVLLKGIPQNLVKKRIILGIRIRFPLLLQNLILHFPQVLGEDIGKGLEIGSSRHALWMVH